MYIFPTSKKKYIQSKYNKNNNYLVFFSETLYLFLPRTNLSYDYPAVPESGQGDGDVPRHAAVEPPVDQWRGGGDLPRRHVLSAQLQFRTGAPAARQK